ncbi:MAG: 4'-phosphopantetheinyl transferase superfamily protein [Lachnospiraceae bacterium]|nr:4'-phosphopantetheinyl transferase superfamily protein [Lachnospiraceae bacterium]
MINVIYSPSLEFTEGKTEGFDSSRKQRLSHAKASNKKNEIYTAGILIDRIKPEGSKVYYKTGGRPEFTKYRESSDMSKNPLDRSFNVTHSGGLVFIAYSDENDVGVDFEPADRHVNDLLEKGLCADSEKEVFEAIEDPDERSRFLLKMFTRKEALAKLLGIGIRMDFPSVVDKGVSQYDNKDEINSEMFVPENTPGRKAGKTYYVRTIMVENGFLSLAYEKGENATEDRFEVSISKY